MVLALALALPSGSEGSTRRTRVPEPVVTGARAWALATTALLTFKNGDRVDILSPTQRTPNDITQTRQLLRDWWGVDTRLDLENSFQFLESGGHRAEFQQRGRRFASMSDAQFRALLASERGHPERIRITNLIRDHYRKRGARSLVAWDYGRYIMLCRWGYTVGYLTADEAWSRIMPAARTIQGSFHSWDEFGEDYLVGREFWSKEETERSGQAYRNIERWLRRDRNSPWKRLPWNMQLP